MNKTLGIIGGLGPEATSTFYLKVISNYHKHDQLTQPSIIISSVPFTFKTPEDLIVNQDTDKWLQLLIIEAQRLEKAGVNFLVMPCNTLHCLINELRESVHIPVVSIVEETCSYVKNLKLSKIGLIATSATIENKVYGTHFEENGIDYCFPNELQQIKINKVISNLNHGIRLNVDRAKIMTTIKLLKKEGAKAMCLACTDLQLLNPNDNEIPILDTVDILAQATVRELLN